eukprot:2896611-Prymnesium_polylepis.1
MKASGDPHLLFAHGGKADFRGADGAIFAFLSSPSLALNVMTQVRGLVRGWGVGKGCEGQGVGEG